MAIATALREQPRDDRLLDAAMAGLSEVLTLRDARGTSPEGEPGSALLAAIQLLNEALAG